MKALFEKYYLNHPTIDMAKLEAIVDDDKIRLKREYIFMTLNPSKKMVGYRR